MKTIFPLSEADARAFENALNCFNASAKPFKIEHSLDLFITDEELITRLKICKKSLYNCREDGYLSFIPFKGRYLTFIPYLLKDLLELNQKKELKVRKQRTRK
ncbi:hypothetical protein LUD75_13800 [Epilithonimonas sp. JDS]|uniref:hypothetical protein n=1 Tax=Epilithonimonas sp. JDS TaxID=2902797 RepID=UPI001E4C7A99|nr:hypothetical protein [Epilithonimonas sp. JDS]MCD9855793.1 hypothetical protein [Epilithonimonas sp. JDS]